MRKVAAYALESSQADEKYASELFEQSLQIVETWLVEKGGVLGDKGSFNLEPGRKGRLIDDTERTPDGEVRRIALIEEIESGVFVTEIVAARKANNCAVFVELRAAANGQFLSPFQYDVRRPKFIGDLLDGEPNWNLGETLLVNKPYTFSGARGAIALVKLIWHVDRAVPLILVSTENGKSITENFISKISGDLCGLAIVGKVDEDAAWALTDLKGAQWSCFNGAIRLYWPMSDEKSVARSHPLWTKETLFRGITEPRDASYRIRSQLRRQILGISAFSIREPRLIRDIRNEIRSLKRRSLEENLQKSVSADDYRDIAESYARDNDQLRGELLQKEEQLSELEDQVENLQVALRYTSSDQLDVRPDEVEEPRTVEESLLRARVLWQKEILFSSDVESGVLGVHPEAGPPDKILRYLSVLAELSRARSAGSLGEGVIPWLANRGITCSVESETTRNSKTEMRKRTWKFDDVSISFDYHLKPSDNVSPDRCVRIYFDLPETDDRVRVGWVGRHPE